jgi:hypothetical protein
MGQLIDHGFGRYYVMDEGEAAVMHRSGASNQVTTSEFARLERAWHNIQHGVGMAISAADADARPAEDRATFLRMLSDAMERSAVVRSELTRIGEDTSPTHHISVLVAREGAARHVLGDSWPDNRVDLDDLETFPVRADRSSPDELVRDEVILHMLAERRVGASHGFHYDGAHDLAIQRQNEWRAERGMAPIRWIDDVYDHSVRDPDSRDHLHHSEGNLYVHYWDGRIEIFALAHGDTFQYHLNPVQGQPTPEDPYGPLRPHPPTLPPLHPVPMHKEGSLPDAAAANSLFDPTLDSSGAASYDSPADTNDVGEGKGSGPLEVVSDGDRAVAEARGDHYVSADQLAAEHTQPHESGEAAHVPDADAPLSPSEVALQHDLLDLAHGLEASEAATSDAGDAGHGPEPLEVVSSDDRAIADARGGHHVSADQLATQHAHGEASGGTAAGAPDAETPLSPSEVALQHDLLDLAHGLEASEAATDTAGDVGHGPEPLEVVSESDHAIAAAQGDHYVSADQLAAQHGQADGSGHASSGDDRSDGQSTDDGSAADTPLSASELALQHDLLDLAHSLEQSYVPVSDASAGGSLFDTAFDPSSGAGDGGDGGHVSVPLEVVSEGDHAVAAAQGDHYVSTDELAGGHDGGGFASGGDDGGGGFDGGDGGGFDGGDGGGFDGGDGVGFGGY